MWRLTARLLTVPPPPGPRAGGVLGLNRVSLLGIVHEIQTGFLQETPVTQFILTTNRYPVNDETGEFDPAAADSSEKAEGKVKEGSGLKKVGTGVPSATTPLVGTSSSKGGSSLVPADSFVADVPYERDNFTVRCFGSLAEKASQHVGEGFLVRVTGKFRVNQQVDLGKDRCFPFIEVGSRVNDGQDASADIEAFIEVVSGSRKKARLEAIQKSVEATLSEVSSRPSSSVINPKTASKKVASAV